MKRPFLNPLHLVPMLCMGTRAPTLCVVRAQSKDAERPDLRYDAERRNEGIKPFYRHSRLTSRPVRGHTPGASHHVLAAKTDRGRAAPLFGRVGDSPYTYPQQACSRELSWPLPRGWNRDHERVLLGRGEQAFEVARQAIRDWTMFPREVATLCWPDCPIEVGRTVAILYRQEDCKVS